MNYIIFKNITLEKMELIKNQIKGLDRSEWNYFKQSIDMYFENKADKIKFEDDDDN